MSRRDGLNAQLTLYQYFRLPICRVINLGFLHFYSNSADKKSMGNSFNHPFEMLKRPYIVAGALTSLIGLLVMFGWMVNSSILVQIRPTFAPMQFNTALGFLLFGLMFFCFEFEKKTQQKVIASLVMLLSGLTLSEYMFGINLGIDEFFVNHSITTRSAFPGRMSPMTSISFFLIALSLISEFVPRLKDSKYGRFSLSLIVLLIAGTNVFSYFFSVEGTFVWQKHTQMAAHTSTAFFILSWAICFCDYIRFRSNDSRDNKHLLFSFITLVFFIFLSRTVISDQHKSDWDLQKKESKIFYEQVNGLINQKVLAYKRLSQRLGLLKLEKKEFWLHDTTEYMQDFGFYNNFLVLDVDGRTLWKNKTEGYRVLDNQKLSENYPGLEKTINEARQSEVVQSSKTFSNQTGEDIFFFVYPIFYQKKFYGTSIGIINKKIFLKKLTNSLNYKRYILNVIDGKGASIVKSAKAKSNKILAEGSENVLKWRFEVSTETQEIESHKDFIGESILILGMIISVLIGGGYYLYSNSIALNKKINQKLNQEQFLAKFFQIAESRDIQLEEKMQRLLELVLALPWNHHKSKGGIFLNINEKLEMIASRDVDPFQFINAPKPHEAYTGIGFDDKNQLILHVPIFYAEKLLGVMIIENESCEFSLDDYFFYENISSKLSRLLVEQELEEEKVRNKQLETIKSMVTTYNHEINNPLTIALLKAQKIKKKVPEMSENKDIESVIKAMERIAVIVKSIDELQNKKNIETESYSDASDLIQLKKSS